MDKELKKALLALITAATQYIKVATEALEEKQG